MTEKASFPKVSIVMSVYNGEAYLAEALDSIFAQTFSDWELIVVDDGSTDTSGEILDAYSDSRLVQIRNERNIGQTRSLNRGLKIARGEFIARQDADDVSHPERFRRQIKFMESRPDIGLLGTSYDIIDQRGQILEMIQPPTVDQELREHLESGNIFCHGSIMIRRDCLDLVGGYNVQFLVAQDYDLWLRLSEHSRLANLEEHLYQYRFDADTVSRSRRDLQLAYSSLAKELALHRRTQGADGPIPDDVLIAYPPEPFRQFGEARWAGYLFYAAGQKQQARASIQRAFKILKKHPMIPHPQWDTWAVGRARVLSNMRSDSYQGLEFLKWFTDIPDLDMFDVGHKLIAEFYADQAFHAYKNGESRRAPFYALQAMRYDLGWIGNRGLWVISWKSLMR